MNTIEFKPEVNQLEVFTMTPAAIFLLGALTYEASLHQLPVKITSIRDNVVGRVSTGHAEGRAFDVSVNGWEKIDIVKFVEEFNARYAPYGALSATDGLPRAIVYHKIEGGNYHLHVQAKRLY